MSDFYMVKKKLYIFGIVPFYEKLLYGGTEPNHVGLFMWGKRLEDFLIYKNGELINFDDFILGYLLASGYFQSMDNLINYIRDWKPSSEENK